MLLITHSGETTINRYRKKRDCTGRYWILSKAGAASNYHWDAALETETLRKAKHKVIRSSSKDGRRSRGSKYTAIFDVLTHEMWVYDSPNEDVHKVYDHSDGWVE